MPKLTLTDGAESYTFEIGTVFRIGRHPENDLPLRESQVSRWHAEVRHEADHHLITDLDSLNGTWVNGERVKTWLLKHGDVIQIGSHELIWQDETAPKEIEASPFSESDLVKPVQELRLEEPIYPIKDSTQAPSYARAFDHLYLLLEIARTLNIAPTVDDFLEVTLEMVLKCLDADRCAVLVKEGNALMPKKLCARKGEFHGEIPVSSTIAGRVMDEGVGLLTADARKDPRFDQGKSISAYDIRSAICVPLWEAGQARGVFYMDNLAVDRAFTEEDLDLAGAIAHHIALGLRQHELIETAKREAVLRHQLERYHSPDVVDLLLRQNRDTQRLELAPQEKEVTILFCDIVDFCSISARSGTVETAALLSDFYDAMTSAVFRHAGSVNKFIGDAVMALWGAPFSHEDDAKRAVLCASDMLRAIYSMLRRLEPEKWFKLRIGINTGKVIAGQIGSKNMLEYTVVGPPVNIAARIQAMAQPNQILISESTRQQLGVGVPTVDLGFIEVKGANSPVRVYELVWKEINITK